MPSAKSIKQRVRSVKNISQITKAMEVVSATKMRRSQQFALRARPYAVASLEMLQNLLVRTPQEFYPPLLRSREVKTSALLVITSDKGLAGAFNANVLRKIDSLLEQYNVLRRPYLVITVGKKVKEYLERRGVVPHKSFWKFGDFMRLEETLPVAELLIEGFLDHSWDEVDAIYMSFRTTLIQQVVHKKILPATLKSIEDAVQAILPERGKYAVSSYGSQATNESRRGRRVPNFSYNYEYKFEPSAPEILDALLPQLIRMHIHHVILESNASEHSARMIAMKNASDNAGDLISKLTLQYNKLRQAGITRELAEITAGKEALEG